MVSAFSKIAVSGLMCNFRGEIQSFPAGNGNPYLTAENQPIYELTIIY